MNAGRKCSAAEIDQLLASVDANGDGKIAKVELFKIFKQVANK